MHPTAIGQKVEVIVEHSRRHVMAEMANCNLELSHAHIRDEESFDSPGGQRRSLLAIFQFPFRRGGDRFDC
jgi:hypothetical protein